MLPKLIQQSGKWYEVNPYVMGLDILMEDLLNIKYLRQPFNYFGLTLLFDFDIRNLHLILTISVNDGEGFSITEKHKKCFEIKNEAGNSFFPNIPKSVDLPNEANPIPFQYVIPKLTNESLVLVFKDPRPKSKSSQLFILLN